MTQITVTQGAFPPWPEPDGDLDASYVEYNSLVGYHTVSGLVVSPTAGPAGTPASVVRTHPPMTYKVIVWSAVRIGAVPVSPSEDTGSANDVLIDKFVGAPFPGLLGSDERVWVVTGWYRYAMLLPPGPSDPLPIGSMPAPYGDVPGSTVYLQPGVDFSPYLHGPVIAPAGSLSEKITF